MAAAKSREIQKLELISKLLQQRLGDGHSGSTHFSYASLSQIPLLDGPVGIEAIMETISDYSHGQIKYSIVRMPMMISHRSDSTGDTSAYSRQEVGPDVPIGITVLVAEPTEVRKSMERVIAIASRNKVRSKKIESIEIVHEEGDKDATIMVNGRIDSSFKVKAEKERWSKLITVAKDGVAHCNDAKSIADYFNTAKKCPLYTRTGCDLTNVLSYDDDRLHRVAEVTIQMITSKTISQRKNKTA